MKEQQQVRGAGRMMMDEEEEKTGIKLDPPRTRIRLAGMDVDAVRMSDAVEQVLAWAERGEACRYVVTPNADHAVLLTEHAQLRRAYGQASLVLADGMSLVLASRLLGRPLPQRVAGSDLVEELFTSAGPDGLRVFLLGAAAGVGERAAARIAQRWPRVEVAGTCSPPPGFELDSRRNDAILAQIAAARADVLLVGLGAPKQELWVWRHRKRITAPVALCIGATIDFLAGEKTRAPVWMRRCGLEWLHRLASEPRRLARRYARDAWIFPRLVWQGRRSC